ncbi:hypothetical protein CHH28_04060 [Bacterioplanes sanyensis]|uniref:Uncharacterized protein n=1 Tax=Bacterioplanes sanyensis TaxID=1249553 RepID=A0A222FGM4_9GAMM|nr:hypothetical protein [Bacterioplanes sanyensis]ASP37899.1 hypothetical protein CHH28_04060 [Bacterioplanes sanyensis]
MNNPLVSIALALALTACGSDGSSSGSSDENPTVESQPAIPDTSGEGGTSSPAPGADGELKNHDQVLFNTSHTAKLEGTQLTLKYLPEPGQGALAIIESDDAEMTLYVSSANGATDPNFVEALKALKKPQQRWIYIPEDRVTEVEFIVESSQKNSELTFTLAKPSRDLLNMKEDDLLLHIGGSRHGGCENSTDLFPWEVKEQGIMNFTDGYRVDNAGNKHQLTKIAENTYSENVVMDFRYTDPVLAAYQFLSTEIEVEYFYYSQTGMVEITALKRGIEHRGMSCTVLYENDKNRFPIVEVVD